MKIKDLDPPRQFSVGITDVKLTHAANIFLANDEMITFVSDENTEYDVVKKNWGYYATPSLGGRLLRFRLRAALMRNIDTRHCFVILVYEDKLDLLEDYMKKERQEIVMWLDNYKELAHFFPLSK
jgi:hypothetical protein